MLLLRSSWLGRSLTAAAGIWSRAASATGRAARRIADQGISIWHASRSTAEQDLAEMGRSPTLFAAVMSQALQLPSYPVVVGRGFSIGGKRHLKPARERWARDFLAVIQAPGLDAAAVFPKPGEFLISQLYVDLTTGNAYVAATFADAGKSGLRPIVGYRRLHPGRVKFLDDTWLTHETPDGRVERLLRSEVAHIRKPSWQAGRQGEMGQGIGACLSMILQGEADAWRNAATLIGQGGADIVVTAKDSVGAAWLTTKENRDRIAATVGEQLRGGATGQRVLVLSGALDAKPTGFAPADLQAGEFVDGAARFVQMVAGTTPTSVGDSKGVYANGVQEMRVQALLLQSIADLIESAWLGPAARYAALVAGTSRVSEITARIDLSAHPGFQAAETDKIARMRSLCEMGWTAEQAAEQQGLDIETPAGTMRLGNTPATPGPDAGSTMPEGRRPVGDQLG